MFEPLWSLGVTCLRLTLSGILTPMDEFQYWQDVSRSAARAELKEAAESYVDLFKPISKVGDYFGIVSLECKVLGICFY